MFNLPNVKIYMTEKESKRRFRWMYTQLKGSLNLTVKGGVGKIPLATIVINDPEDEDQSIFEFELPLNFKHEKDLHNKFYVIESFNKQYIGFLFETTKDK